MTVRYVAMLYGCCTRLRGAVCYGTGRETGERMQTEEQEVDKKVLNFGIKAAHWRF